MNSIPCHSEPILIHFLGIQKKKPNRRYTMLYPHEFLWYPHVVKNIPISYRQLVIPKCLFPRYIPITLWQSSIAKGNFRYMEVYSWEHHRTKLNGWFSSKLRLIAGVYSPMFFIPMVFTWYSLQHVPGLVPLERYPHQGGFRFPRRQAVHC